MFQKNGDGDGTILMTLPIFHNHHDRNVNMQKFYTFPVLKNDKHKKKFENRWKTFQ